MNEDSGNIYGMKNHYHKPNMTLLLEMAMDRKIRIQRDRGRFRFCDETSCQTPIMYSIAVFRIILLFMIIVCNGVALFIIKNIKRSSPSNNLSTKSFKISKVLADLLFGLSLLLPSIYQNIKIISRDGEHFQARNLTRIMEKRLDNGASRELGEKEVLEYIMGYICLVSAIAQTWSIFAIQFDLFLKIRWPLKYHVGKLMTSKRAKLLTTMIWILAIGLTGSVLQTDIIFVLNPIRRALRRKIRVNRERYQKVLVFVGVVIGLPLAMTIPLAVYLMFLVGIQSKKLPENVRRNSKEGKQSHFNEKQLTKTRAALKRVVIIELIFILTFLPFIVSTIEEWKRDRRSLVNKIYFLSSFLVCTGCFSNVFVYQFMWNDFRKRFQAMFSDFFGEKEAESPSNKINSRKKIEGPSLSCETQV
ncbi:unnamed protein product [Oikopleura dioica]|uniref:G-protein coupled receptors family 1 profile domain-containing protein n=1 Tax=Oikopleura dioica TaxID=34765 RepID=E4XDN2_OIKDI|nr:unnamed protein product [Oikopleura dioica]